MNFNLHINKILLETSDWTGSIVKWTEPSDGNEYVIMTDHGDSVDIVNTSYFVRSKQPPPRGYWLRQIPKSFFTVVKKANDTVRQSTNEVYPDTPGDTNNRPAAKADSPMGATVYHYDAPKGDNPAKSMSPYTTLFLALLEASLFGENNATNYYKSLPPQAQEMIRADLVHVAKSTGTEDKLMPLLKRLEMTESKKKTSVTEHFDEDEIIALLSRANAHNLILMLGTSVFDNRIDKKTAMHYIDLWIDNYSKSSNKEALRQKLQSKLEDYLN